MPRAGPPYSPEFRAEAVQRLSSGGTTVADLSHELGVSESTLRRWRLQAGDHREEAAGRPMDEPPRPEEPERKDRPLREEGDGTRPADHRRLTRLPRPSRRGRSAVGGSPSAIRERIDPCGYSRGSPQMSSTSVWSSSPRPPSGRRAACAGTRTSRTSRGASEGRTQKGMVGAGDLRGRSGVRIPLWPSTRPDERGVHSAQARTDASRYAVNDPFVDVRRSRRARGTRRDGARRGCCGPRQRRAGRRGPLVGEHRRQPDHRVVGQRPPHVRSQCGRPAGDAGRDLGPEAGRAVAPALRAPGAGGARDLARLRQDRDRDVPPR